MAIARPNLHYLSYISAGLSTSTCPAGHAFVAITIFDQQSSEFIVPFKIGLTQFNQVILHDFYREYLLDGKRLDGRTYPISKEELLKLLIKINRDRSLPRVEPVEVLYVEKRIKAVNAQNLIGKKESSIPSGVPFACLNIGGTNCKEYALSLLETAGINDSILTNMILPIPNWSGHLIEVKLDEVESKKPKNERAEKWSLNQQPFRIHSCLSYDTFTPAELEAHQLLVDTGRVKVYQNPSRKKRVAGFVIGTSVVAIPLFTFLSPASLLCIAIYSLLSAAGGKIGYNIVNKNVSINKPQTAFFKRSDDISSDDLRIDVSQPLLQNQLR